MLTCRWSYTKRARSDKRSWKKQSKKCCTVQETETQENLDIHVHSPSAIRIQDRRFRAVKRIPPFLDCVSTVLGCFTSLKKCSFRTCISFTHALAYSDLFVGVVAIRTQQRTKSRLQYRTRQLEPVSFPFVCSYCLMKQLTCLRETGSCGESHSDIMLRICPPSWRLRDGMKELPPNNMHWNALQWCMFNRTRKLLSSLVF
jgi:hypothetical protein